MASARLFLVLQREFLTRVRKPTFLIMTLLGPLLIIALYGGVIWLALSEEKETLIINIVDDSEVQAGQLVEELNRHSELRFVRVDSNLIVATDRLAAGEAPYNALLYLPRDVVNAPSGITLGFSQRPGMSLIRAVEYLCQKAVEHHRLLAHDIDPHVYEMVRAPFHIKQYAIQEDGSRTRTNEAPYIWGYVASLIMYVSVLLYGAQTMRGVMEEKAGRVAEVLLSSVRPFELMTGKIIGIALVGLLQFFIWIVFSAMGIFLLALWFLPEAVRDPDQLQILLNQSTQRALTEGKEGVNPAKVAELLRSVNLGIMIPTFLFYFLGGYFFYSALFAALGSLIDSESDAQQFALPVTLPLIFSIAVAMAILNNPDGRLGTLFSMIPFTSPVVMMVRIPFGVAIGEFFLSALILVASFVFSVWVSARIYRVGILLYGKKPQWRDVLRYAIKG